MLFVPRILWLYLAVAGASALEELDGHLDYEGPDYEALSNKTIFPGPWEQNIRAPRNKSHIAPVGIYKFEGAVAGQESVLQDADVKRGLSWVISPSGLITFEFEENISGHVCFDVEGLANQPYIVLAYSESPFFADKQCDATDNEPRDLPLQFAIEHTGVNCVGGGYNRGGFKYLTVYMPEHHIPTEGGLWHDGHEPPQRTTIQDSWYERIGQKIFGGTSRNDTASLPAVTISAVWVNCTAYPSMPNGRAYTGYFDSSSSLLNRVWYAGAWTLQLSTIVPNQGGCLIEFNRFFDHNNAPRGGWYSNYTIANGTAVTTDGAKRDRMVWPGDMSIAIPGIAVSTYDMVAIRNALETIYNHQYGDGSMPYAGPPMGAFGEFSDTYHLHTLIGTFYYVLYSGDLEWLEKRWSAYTRALQISINKVDGFDLMHVSSTSDWNRPGLTGHNVEASAILHAVLGNSIKLASWLDKNATGISESWEETQSRLKNGITNLLYCEQDGLYADNKGYRGCSGPEKCLPQDGNSWVLISKAFSSPSVALTASEALRSRWTKFGAPAVEWPNVISPFASSFELLGHNAAGNIDATVELTELMWGYMLEGPGMTNSTLLEGYRMDGYIHYPAYPAAARNSHAHGWSTGPTTALMEGVLGIKLTSPLGKTWEIKPQLTKWLSWARGGFATRLGKFEVAIELMRSLSTGRKIEALKITVPKGTSGAVSWGGSERVITQSMGSSFQWYRFLDAGEMVPDEGWWSWSVDSEKDFVRDDTWIKPKMVERSQGLMDWSLLAEGYERVKQKFELDYWAGDVRGDGDGDGDGDRDVVEGRYELR